MRYLIPAALVGIAALVRAAVRRHWHYEEPPDNSEVTPDPPENDPAKLAEALDAIADERGLKWRTSIVDFLKVLHEPARFVDRDAMWRSCGETEVYRGTAEQNVKLHKIVMEKLRLGGMPMPKGE